MYIKLYRRRLFAEHVERGRCVLVLSVALRKARTDITLPHRVAVRYLAVLVAGLNLCDVVNTLELTLTHAREYRLPRRRAHLIKYLKL